MSNSLADDPKADLRQTNASQKLQEEPSTALPPGQEKIVIPAQFQRLIEQAMQAEQDYQATGQPLLLGQAVTAWEQILHDDAFSRAAEPFQLAIMNDAGGAYLRRYWAQGQLIDLNRALELWQKVVQRTPPDSHARATFLNNLGLVLSDRYYLTGQQTDLEAAITAFQDAVHLTPSDSPDLTSYLNNLGNGLSTRYVRTGQLDDLKAAIAVFQNAVKRTPKNSPDRAGCLNNLGNGLHDRYAHTGQLADLEAAIAAYQEAVQRTPPDSPDRTGYLNNLGNGLRAHYARTGQPADLEAAIAAYQEAVQRTPPDSPDRTGYLNNLGNGLRAHYARTGQLADLEAAIAAYQEAVQRTPPDSPDRTGYLNNLGNGLHDRYAHTGQVTDLEVAIAVYQEAVQRTPKNSPDRAGYLNNMGSGLRAQFIRTGQLADLEVAIAAFRQAVQRTSPDSSARAGRFTNLGNSLRDRYLRIGQPDDLEEALIAFQDAIQCTPLNSPDRAGRLTNLGNGLRDRYLRTGHLTDLEAAIVAYREAVQCALPDSPDRAGYFTNLGSGLRARYVHTSQLDDLEAAIAAYQEAVHLSPPDAAAHASHLNSLGIGLSNRYAHTGQLADLEAATNAYREACRKGLILHREVTLIAASNWGNWALTRHTWSEAAEAYQYGLDALDQLYRAQLLRQSRQSWQKEARDLVIRAAYAQARAGQFEQAILTLEQGRTRQLNERLARDQARLEGLTQQYPQLVNQYRQLTDQLHQLETAERQQVFRNTQAPDWTQHRQQLQSATAQLDALIKQIRQVPSYETFLSPLSWTTLLVTLQPDVPLLYLLTTEVGSLGLLVQTAPENQGTVTPIWLDNFTEDDLNTLLIKRADGDIIGGYLPGQLGQWHWLRTALREGLPQLGTTMMAPIATHLHQQAIKQFVVIPTGRLNLLPLNAVPYTIDGQTEFFGNAFCVTYAPSAQSVAHSRRRVASQPTTPPTLLSVGDPQPVTANPLIFARHEAGEVMHYFPERGELFLTTEATLPAIKSRLAQANYIHFSCHGLFEPENPLQSGLLFSHNQRLTLADLLDEANLTAARLAILSACQTAVNDFNDLPDEVIGLPAGFLQAGVPGVIGTLWPVNDHSTALLMVRFYHYHIAEGLPPAAALQKAQHWLRNATRQEIGDYYKSFIRMSAEEASDLHWKIRKEGKPDDRPYAHPYYWAAFTFYGV